MQGFATPEPADVYCTGVPVKICQQQAASKLLERERGKEREGRERTERERRADYCRTPKKIFKFPSLLSCI